MKKFLLILPILLFSVSLLSQDIVSERVITFRFVPGKDMFFVPWMDNESQLAELFSLVDQYRQEITSGSIPIYVDGYCASLKTSKANINVAYLRASRVKSELIVRKGLLEAHFITRNLTTAYNEIGRAHV